MPTPRQFLVALLVAFACLAGSSSKAAVFKWASDGDVNSMDPYARSETFLLTFMQNVYEPLVRRDANLNLEPALATGWERVTPTVWRFHLRPGVRFQDGTPFTAEDVVFSYRRATGPTSQLRSWFSDVVDVSAIDAQTVDFETDVPNPVFVEAITFWGIMSQSWCVAHGAETPTDLSDSVENYATRHANGTGPFMLELREPDRRTVLLAAPDWWDKPQHNLTEVEFDVIANPAGRVAALLSGEVSMLYSVPPQAFDLLARSQGIRMFQMPELRTVFLGFDQSREVLLHSDVTDRNPFKDPRVRQAFNEAIDIEAIHQRIMRGQSHPTGLLYGPGIKGYSVESDLRWPHDVEHARVLMREAGYANGFGVTLDCPNDRYVNDEAICKAIEPMLARIGVRLTLNIKPRMQHFARVNGPGYQTSFYMLGWVPNTYDAYNTLFNLAGSRAGARGLFNNGGYTSAAFDALLERIRTEQDAGTRTGLIEEASRILHDDAAYLPLHQQTVSWAARDNIDLQQSPDNAFQLRLVTIH